MVKLVRVLITSGNASGSIDDVPLDQAIQGAQDGIYRLLDPITADLTPDATYETVGDEDGTCIAITAKGTSCKRFPTDGRYCKLHKEAN
jgi:hypothetical protein